MSVNFCRERSCSRARVNCKETISNDNKVGECTASSHSSVWSTTLFRDIKNAEEKNNRIVQPGFVGISSRRSEFIHIYSLPQRGIIETSSSAAFHQNTYAHTHHLWANILRVAHLERLWLFSSNNIRPAGDKSAPSLSMTVFTFTTLRFENGELQAQNGTRGRKVNLIGMAFFSPSSQHLCPG